MSLKTNEKINDIKLKIDKQSDLKKRVISSVFLFIVLGLYVGLSIIYTQGAKDNLKNADVAGYFNLVFTILLVSGSSYELMKAMGIGNENKLYYIPGIIGAIFLTIMPFNGNESWALYKAMNVSEWNTWYIVMIEIIFGVLLFFLIGFYGTKSISNSFILIIYMFVIVIGFKGFSEIALSMSGDKTPIPLFGFNTIIWIWSIIILTDSFAYFGGRKFGKTKLAPTISPKKTWEGSAIGSSVAIIFGTVYGILFFYLLQDYSPFHLAMGNVENRGKALPPILLILLSILISVTSQIGDLFFSWYKRLFNVKDFSKLIPGHGGILDRLDSFLFVFFIMYFIALAAR